MRTVLQLAGALALILLSSLHAAAQQYGGQVSFGGFPVPGATVTLTSGVEHRSTVTNAEGRFSFPDLSTGKWTLEVSMLCFADLKRTITIPQSHTNASLELELLPRDQIRSLTQPAPHIATPQPPDVATQPSSSIATQPEQLQTQQNPDTPEQADDSLLINGSINNAAVSPFSQARAFGNTRSQSRHLYNGGIGLILDNSTLDARPYALTGVNLPKAYYNRAVGFAALGGPLRIPHLLPRGPTFFAAYQWTRDSDTRTQSALVPTAAERSGDFSQVAMPLYNPATGLPYPNNQLPVSPQARALVDLYPLPNVAGSAPYNLQSPTLNQTHQDTLQSRLDKQFGRRNQLYGTFAFQSNRVSATNLFRFTDRTRSLGLDLSANWSHRFSSRLSLDLSYRFNRLSTRSTPWWQDRANISGDAGITGNNQDPVNWGPPALNFSNGTATLSDAQSSFNRNQTNLFSGAMLITRGTHNITYGGDFRRQQFNYLAQQDARGAFSFTGAATRSSATEGSAFADFILGIPDASSIAFGNADKYLRQSVSSLYVNDDWRARPGLTINAGLRWEYGAPITEIKDRLVNLDIASGFTAAAPVLASSPTGSITGAHYPSSLIRPYRGGWEPRIGLAWRPLPASSLLIRAGYGIYYDTSVYQSSAILLAQQSPLSKSLSVQNSAACPLTLANGFNTCPTVSANTFAVDPAFRGGYAQNWQLSLQADLAGSLQLVATYLGIKGTHEQQRFLPNTYAPGGFNPCPSCPVGFTYLASNANSTREAAQIQLRRRLRSGLAGSLAYTYASALDDASTLGGQRAELPTQATPSNPFAPTPASQSAATTTIAQDWRNLSAEYGRSSFNQRHLLNLQLQYTTGMGIGGGTLLKGWRGTLLKEWTGLVQISASSGLPQTPIYSTTVPGIGITGTVRPNVTTAPLYNPTIGLHLNPAAFAAPSPGEWGDARRNSINGPSQFLLNGSLGRTFRVRSRSRDSLNLDVRMDFTNLLNHAAWSGWNTVINSPQFGVPSGVNPMRSIQTSVRMRF